MANEKVAIAGDAIRATREAMGLSIRAFADRAGCSYAYLSQVERGERTPSKHWLRTVEEALATELVERRAS